MAYRIIEIVPNPSAQSSSIKVALINFHNGPIHWEIIDLHSRILEHGVENISSDMKVITMQELLTCLPAFIYSRLNIQPVDLLKK